MFDRCLLRSVLLIALLLGVGGLGVSAQQANELYVAPAAVLEVIDQDIAAADRSYLNIAGERQELDGAYSEEDGLALLFDGGFVFVEMDWQEVYPTGVVELFYGKLVEDEAGHPEFKVNREYLGEGLKIQAKGEDWVVSGQVRDGQGKRVRVALRFGEGMLGAGSTRIEVADEVAYLSGDLGSRTYRQLETMLREHPEVKTLVLTDVPGSINDEANVHTGRLLHSSGVATHLKADSVIASGGVDLFLSGQKRTIERGARLGVHSWGGTDGTSANDYPKDDPAHHSMIAFFKDILGERGPAFYFYTIQAADFDEMHWMSEDEIKHWQMATE